MTRGNADACKLHRGAGSSKGKTSWSGKPELHDYISFIGFFIHYVTAIRLPGNEIATSGIRGEPLRSIPTGVSMHGSHNPKVGRVKIILGGYSYGSLIASHVPAIEMIMQRFSKVKRGTAEDEIRSRASDLAAQWSRGAQIQHERHRERCLKTYEDQISPGSPEFVAVGGDDCESRSRRSSREPRRSIDAIRRSFERTRKSLSRRPSEGSLISSEVETTVSSNSLQAPEVYYLLISPLLPPVSGLVTMFSKLSASWFRKGPLNSTLPDLGDRLSSFETLAIYGGNDFFTSHKKLRAWSEALSSRPNSHFCYHEVPRAGHLWLEEGVEAEMRQALRQWLEQVRGSTNLGC